MLDPDQSMYVDWAPYIGLSYSDECDSTFDLNRLKQLGVILNTVPEGFVLQRQVQKPSMIVWPCRQVNSP